MRHREITDIVVAGVDRLLGQGRDRAEIAERLGVSKYVVGVVADDKERRRRRAPKRDKAYRYPSRPNTADMATIRMIQRMLDVGLLYHKEIAREAGVSANFVTLVATGKRLPLDTARPPLADDECFLKMPVRCSTCGRRISIVPCRACRAVDEAKEFTLCM
jgi:DNA-directed RNA polymerase subunit N (RpoN/RPB10)